jgi:hypothetical protein
MDSLSRRGGTVLAATAALLLIPGVAASTAIPVPEGAPLSAIRQETVDRARAALNNPRKFKTSSTSSVYLSTVLEGEGRNVLERNGSNANRNIFNDFNGQEWCGYFAAAVWTGVNTPDPANFPKIPNAYPSSQAWRESGPSGVGDRFHPFRAGGAMPKPADVLVWTNNDASTGGHVGVVVSVNYDTNKVTTIEGNVNGDEVARKVYAWDSNGPTLSGKVFRGFTSRE